MNRKTKYKFRSPFNPAIEMGVLIPKGAVRAYGKLHGAAALGQMMDTISIACEAQDRNELLRLPLVGKIVVRPFTPKTENE